MSDATSTNPHILSHEQASSLEQPISREESRARAEQLNASGQDEKVSILPHPAKDNDPNPPKDLTGDAVADATKARPPHVLSKEQAAGLGEPASRDELRKRAEELNS